ncbi:hypothetical protein SAMN03159376_01850 [Pseudomonas sp. NFACC09-4]|nr:hypothetical protein ALQ87_02063 [Pseudomonas savastanoi pv. glycinea]SFW49002.1 hypothetical protein SAMN03159376_01850 [Pseudomonas sp. NFACC09-4]
MKSTCEGVVSFPRSRSHVQLAQQRIMQLIAAGQMEALRHGTQITHTQKNPPACSRPG